MTTRARFAMAMVGVLAVASAVTPKAPATPVPVRPVALSALHRLVRENMPVQPNEATCRVVYGIDCYTPAQIQRAYNVAALHTAGITGRGRTIAIVVPFGSPTVAEDLAVFDAANGLPDPPSIRTITPVGALPPFDPTDEQMNGWAFETSLDVQYAHVLAPEANILVVATPVAETEGIQGFPEIVAAENYVIDNGLADVISQSFGAAESTFADSASLMALRSAFVNAARRDVTVLAAAGDTGATDYELDGQTLSASAVTGWPSSDPLVTSVGGTHLRLDADGNRLAADSVWGDAFGAGGGGVSSVFGRPSYQGPVSAVVGSRRGTPDVAMSGGVDGGVVVYAGYDPANAGWGVVGGTSEATPLFAGVVALASQAAGRRLGLLNRALYSLPPGSGLVDVTSGDNTFGGVPGTTAGLGYDLASGLGTVDAATLVPALASWSDRPLRARLGGS